MRYAKKATLNKAAVPIFPKKLISQLLIISPTAPPKAKSLFAKTKARETDITSIPTMT